MSLIDVAIPLVAGIFLVVCPRQFIKKGIPEQDAETRSVMMRKIGYVLIGVSVIYLSIALSQ